MESLFSEVVGRIIIQRSWCHSGAYRLDSGRMERIEPLIATVTLI